MQAQGFQNLKKLSFSATTVKPVAWERSSVLLLTRLPVFSRYSTCTRATPAHVSRMPQQELALRLQHLIKRKTHKFALRMSGSAVYLRTMAASAACWACQSAINERRRHLWRGKRTAGMQPKAQATSGPPSRCHALLTSNLTVLLQQANISPVCSFY